MKFEKIVSDEKIRTFIDTEIEKGSSYSEIAKELSKTNVSISSAYIGQYAKQVLNKKSRPKFGRDTGADTEPTGISDLDEILQGVENPNFSLDIDSKEIDELTKVLNSQYNEDRNKVRRELCPILANQLLIVRELQQRYIDGLVKYPKDQISNLNTLCVLMEKLHI